MARTVHAVEAISGFVGYVAATRGFRFDLVSPGTYTLTVYVQGKPLSVQATLSPGTEASAQIFLP